MPGHNNREGAARVSKPDFEYTPTEMQRRIDEYFETCSAKHKKPTWPGLCLALEITTARATALIKAYNANSNDEAAREGKKHLQLKHLKRFEIARCRLLDELEQHKDVMTIFALKQMWAGYSDRPETNANDAININIKLDGVAKGINPGG